MAIDTAVVGTELDVVTMQVERGRLRLFAKAIGETDPVYLDPDAAQAAGHPDLPVPPTFLCAIGQDQPDPLGWLSDLDIDRGRVLHGEQSFRYHRMAYAGETLTARTRITDVCAKRDGALDLITRETVITDEEGSAVANLTDVVVIRNSEVNQ